MTEAGAAESYALSAGSFFRLLVRLRFLGGLDLDALDLGVRLGDVGLVGVGLVGVGLGVGVVVALGLVGLRLGLVGRLRVRIGVVAVGGLRRRRLEALLLLALLLLRGRLFGGRRDLVAVALRGVAVLVVLVLVTSTTRALVVLRRLDVAERLEAHRRLRALARDLPEPARRSTRTTTALSRPIHWLVEGCACVTSPNFAGASITYATTGGTNASDARDHAGAEVRDPERDAEHERERHDRRAHRARTGASGNVPNSPRSESSRSISMRKRR